jgi:cysteine-S-conjugate beta-lyase
VHARLQADQRWSHSAGRRGVHRALTASTFVSNHDARDHALRNAADFSPLDLRVPDLARLHERRSEKWAEVEPDVLASTIAEMDFPLAPPVAAALRAAVERHDLGYSPPAPESLREAFAAFAARRLAWELDPGQVELVPDVMIGLVELCRTLAAPGDAVAFASPAYPPFFTHLPRTGVRIRPLGLGTDGAPDPDELDAALADGLRVLVLANPHNPSGRVIPRGALERIAERCAAHGTWVLADEVHAPLVLRSAVHTPWLEVSDAARARGIALTSSSKAFNLAGLKAALAVSASVPAREPVRRLRDLADHVGLLGVVAAEAAFTDGDVWLDACSRSSRPTAPSSASGWPPTFRAWRGRRRRRRISPGSTAAPSGSATIPPRPSSRAAASPSAQGSTTARQARGSCD